MENKNSQIVDLRKNKKTIEWVAPEFKKYKKGRNWLALPTLIVIIALIIAILLKNFLFGIIIVLAAIAFYIYAKKEPREIKFAISDQGIKIDQTVYKFDDLKSFWILYDPPEIKELSLRSNKTFMTYIKIPLGEQNPIELRKFLLKFLPERKHTESIIDTWMKKIKF